MCKKAYNIRLWKENFLVGINFSVFANQPAEHHKPVMCGVPICT